LLEKRIKWRRLKEPPPSLVPPDIQKFGSVDFLASDRSSLSAWLSEKDWPRDTMSVVAIEGYLVAMIVWPVNVPPGAWLPAIWGIRGWKVAAKIEAPACYDRFLRLILGYRQHLTHILDTAPLSFVPALHESVAGSAGANAAMRWSKGFMAGLQQGLQGFDYRSPQSLSAVSLIAFHASSVAPFSGKSESFLAAELGSAVRTIISETQLGIRKPAARLAASALRH
jgi:hypothetical protein